MMSMYHTQMKRILLLLLHNIAGKIGNEITVAVWQFLHPLSKYNLPNIMTYC